MKKPHLYRQGDVLIIPVKSIPKTAKKQNGKKCVLALGEVTGHHHRIESGATKFIDPETQCSYVEVAEALADLQHEEHSTISLPRGKYKVLIQSEYSPEAIRSVLD